MRQELVNPAVRMRRQTCEHVLQIRMRIMTVQRGGLNEAHDGRRTSARPQRSCEEPIAPFMQMFA